MHWGSPENLSDVTHPFLRFSLTSPASLSELCTTHCFLMVLMLLVVVMEIVCDFCHSKCDFNFIPPVEISVIHDNASCRNSNVICCICSSTPNLFPEHHMMDWVQAKGAETKIITAANKTRA